jgi:hypothetical protein
MYEVHDRLTPSLLFHVVRILLHRPLLSVRNQNSTATPSSFQLCRSAAVDIHAILSLWGKTYGVCNMVYLMMFTTFVAAGVDVIILRLGAPQMRAEALNRVQLSLAILEQASQQGPGKSRDCRLIVKPDLTDAYRYPTWYSYHLCPTRSCHRTNDRPNSKSYCPDVKCDEPETCRIIITFWTD